jgi:subtilisin family serine protease
MQLQLGGLGSGVWSWRRGLQSLAVLTVAGGAAAGRGGPTSAGSSGLQPGHRCGVAVQHHPDDRGPGLLEGRVHRPRRGRGRDRLRGRPVPGLDGADKLYHGPDVSFEAQVPELAHLDTYGHGTHMAGIIAGRADAAVAGRYPGDTTSFLGMAPDARIINLKAADAAGATDITQVIAAVDWVAEHQHDNGLNIRVLNLSFGTDSRQLPKVDPLAHAVERAWKRGIVVVVSAGNAGFNMANGGPGSPTRPATPTSSVSAPPTPKAPPPWPMTGWRRSPPAASPGPPGARTRICWPRAGRWPACGCRVRSWTRPSGPPPR